MVSFGNEQIRKGSMEHDIRTGSLFRCLDPFNGNKVLRGTRAVFTQPYRH